MRLLFAALTVICFSTHNFSQSLIMNEVSNGETGNQEYVEFIVVDTSVVYDCNSTTPPCIDIRGWIFDDNSGYHGSPGIAAGCVRFSFDNLWSCVPVGTIIVIHNDDDQNPEMPANDLSVSDGNFKIIAPISNSNLFESNPTTPGDVACSYPASGWVPGGDWNYTLLANGGDCARIVDLSGCEVFSVCWNSNDQNNLIYFQGGATSTNSASNTVYYFNDNDPANQGNWSIGCADFAACGMQEQTPGEPNNAANAAYIAQFNNGGNPITPISASAVVDNDDACICDGQATASGSGSIPGYTFEWFNSSFTSIGQTNATATNLCAGTYNVIVTSTIGCSDTASVTINSIGGGTIQVNSENICEGESTTLTATSSIPGGTYNWITTGESTQSITVSPTATTTYNLEYEVNGCTSTGQGTVTVNPIPNVFAGPDIFTCTDSLIVLAASGAASYSWNNNVTDGMPFSALPGSITYTVVGSTNGCTASDELVVFSENCAEECNVQLLIPNVFTPNNDNSNDEFKVSSITDCPATNFEISIFNRWGNIVFQSNIDTFLWDGTNLNGTECTAGTYFYKINYLENETQQEKSGFMTLVR